MLNKDPDWDALSEDVPLVARRLLRRCLAKDARHRLQHIGDARVELEEIGIDASEPSAHARWSSRAIAALLIVVAAAVATTALLLLWLSPAATRAPLIRFDLIVPPEIRVEEYHGGAISPDGQHFAVGAIVDGRQQLVLRHMGSTALVPLAGTEGGFDPFWSPDSQSIGFFHFDGYLRQVLLTGGPVRRLADATSDGPNYGGTWRGGVSRTNAAERTDQPGNPAAQGIAFGRGRVGLAVELLVPFDEVGVGVREPRQELLAHAGAQVQQDRRDVGRARVDAPPRRPRGAAAGRR